MAFGQVPDRALINDLNIPRRVDEPAKQLNISVQLVDSLQNPVVDADVATKLIVREGQAPVWWVGAQKGEGRSVFRSDADGMVRIPLQTVQAGHSVLYALAADKQSAGIIHLPHNVPRDLLWKAVLSPCCRVFGRCSSASLAQRGEPISVPVEIRKNFIHTSIFSADNEFLFQQSSDGAEFEIYLPAGQYFLRPHHVMTSPANIPIVVQPGERELDLNTVELLFTPSPRSRFQDEFETYGRSTVVQPIHLSAFTSTFCFSRDGRILATAHGSGRGKYAGVDLWDCQSGHQIHSERWAQSVFDLDFSPDGKLLAIAADEVSVAVLDIETKQRREFANGHTQPVECVAFASDTMTLASASETEVLVWDARSGSPRQKLPTGAVPRGLSLSSDGSLLATSQYGNVTLWSLDSGQQIARYTGNRLFNRGASILPDDRTLLCYSGHLTRPYMPGQLRRYSIPAGIELPAFQTDGTPIHAAVDRDGERVAVITGQGIDIWSLRDSQLIAQFAAGTDSPRVLAFTPDGTSLAVLGTRFQLKIVGVSLARPRSKAARLEELKQSAPATAAMALSPNGKLLFTGHTSPIESNRKSKRYPLYCWNLRDGALLRELSAHQAPLTSIVVTAAGQIVSAAESGEITLHDETGAEIRRWLGHQRAANQLLLLTNPPRLVSAGDDGAIRFWNLDTGEQLQQLTSGLSPIVALAATSDGRQLYSADRDHTIHLWDLELSKVVRTIPTPLMQVHSLAVAPDGESLAAAGLVSVNTRNYMTEFGEIRQWKIGDWTPLPSLRQQGAVTSITFSPCGKYLASAGLDPQIKIWLPRQGYHWGTVERDAGSYHSRVLFSSDGTSMITSGATPVTIWRTPEPDPRILAEFDKQ